MGKFVLQDQLILADSLDLTGDTNAMVLQYGSELKDCSVLQNSTRSNLGGLFTVQLQASGFYEPASDAELFPNMGISNKPISVAAEGSAVGDVGYFFNAVLGELTSGESVGEVNKYSIGAGAQGKLIRGVLAHNARETAETASGNGTTIQLGAVGSSQSLYAVIHVLESSGTGDQTLDVIIQSDDGAGMASPITALTFTQATTSGTSELLELAGPTTDDYFRVNFTIAGSGSPSFKFVVFFGVL